MADHEGGHDRDPKAQDGAVEVRIHLAPVMEHMRMSQRLMQNGARQTADESCQPAALAGASAASITSAKIGALNVEKIICIYSMMLWYSSATYAPPMDNRMAVAVASRPIQT